MMNVLCHRCSFTSLKFHSMCQRYFMLFRLALPSTSVWLENGSVSLQCTYATRAKSYYEVLEVMPQATDKQIKSAYYRLSKKYHPDRNASKESKARFTQIAEAYETLGNKRLRKMYDTNQISSSGQGGHSGSYASSYPQYKRRTTAPTGRSSIYNFDEFYRKHYGEAWMGRRIRKEAYDKAVKERREMAAQNKRIILTLLVFSICTIIFNLFH